MEEDFESHLKIIDTFLQQNFVFKSGEKWQSKFCVNAKDYHKFYEIIGYSDEKKCRIVFDIDIDKTKI